MASSSSSSLVGRQRNGVCALCGESTFRLPVRKLVLWLTPTLEAPARDGNKALLEYAACHHVFVCASHSASDAEVRAALKYRYVEEKSSDE